MKKKLLALLLTTVFACTLFGCGSTGPSDTGQNNADNANDKAEEKSAEEKTYGVGDTWEVDGQWKLTINSVTPTEDRNEYADTTPAQVLILDYTYENIGYEDQSGLMTGVYFDLSSAQSVDSTGTMGYSYPDSTNVVNFPQQVPVGANCTAQAAIGVDNAGNSITLNVSNFDGNSKNQTAKFELLY